MLHNFYWVIEGEIAGMAMPTASRAYLFLEDADTAAREEMMREIKELKRLGIGAVVTLTEEPLAGHLFEAAGLRYLHIPIPDMTAPTQSQIREFVEFSHRQIENDKAVVVHCMGGSGRTGTMIACYLISRGYAPASAIQAVREENPSAIETHWQQEAIEQYAMNKKNPKNDSDFNF